jgi:anti-sigma B factor antagonist
MEIKSYQRDGVAVFQITGEVNIMTSPELKKRFEGQSVKKVVVDLQNVSYVDSSGLATLVEMLKKTKLQGGSFGLSGLSDKVKSLFEITKLDKLFPIFATSEDAVSSAK